MEQTNIYSSLPHYMWIHKKAPDCLNKFAFILFWNSTKLFDNCLI